MAPTGTWVARLDPNTLQMLSFAPAPDSGTRLFGWSVVSDDTHSYLYGHCYRQYVNKPPTSPAQFDSTCMPNAWLARVPLGHFEMAPEYWTGTLLVAGGDAGDGDDPRAQPSRGGEPGERAVVRRRLHLGQQGQRLVGDDHRDRPRPPAGGAVGEGAEQVGRRRPQVPERLRQLPRLPDAVPRLGRQHDDLAVERRGVRPVEGRTPSLYRPTFYSVPLPGPATHRQRSRAAVPSSRVAGTAGFEPVDPVRLVDTREPGAAFGRLRPGTTVDARPARSRMPAGTQAVALNLAATGATESGFVRAYPCDGNVPATSSINPVAGATTSNAAVVPVGDGQVCLQTLRETELIVDLNGWLTTAATVGLAPVTPRTARRHAIEPRRLRASRAPVA